MSALISGQEKEYHKCEVLHVPKNLSLGSQFSITWQSLVMPNCDPRDRFFYQYLKLMKDSYSLSVSHTYDRLFHLHTFGCRHLDIYPIFGQLQLFFKCQLILYFPIYTCTCTYFNTEKSKPYWVSQNSILLLY